jgi:heme ABC exporter ATP-binding subunit CcmA
LAGRSGRRRTIHALDAVSFHIDRGEVRALLGPNGSGKSTLLRTLATLVLPDEGSATIDGFDIVRDDLDVRRQVAWVPADDRSFNLRLTGRENLRLFAQLHGNAPEAIGDALDEVALTEAADDVYASYSTGMRQRLALARALLGRPTVLLLDEPFRALDDASSSRLLDLLRRRAAEGVTVLVATHHLDELGSLPSGALTLDQGRLVS